MITIYLCGPTVYNRAHIGNMRPILIFDIYLRALKFIGHDITFIHNITDIDDKIIIKAQQEGVDEQLISDRYANHYFYLLKLFNVNKPTWMPRVTTYIPQIISFIEKLVLQGNAYIKNDGVWFDVSKIKNYGSLSKQNLSLLHYEHTDHGTKNNPADFALWKKTNKGVSFDSPWGKGRPGWHTECVVMINEITNGQQLELHGGGVDLIFPHHENENAQYIALKKRNITKSWMHIGHLSVNNQKMSKSLNNMIDSEEFINLYGDDTLRMMFLITNPTAPIDVSEQMITNAKSLVDKFKKAFLKAQLHLKNKDKSKKDKSKIIKQVAEQVTKWQFSNVVKEILQQIKNFYQTFNNGYDIIMLMNLIGFKFSLIKVSDEDKILYHQWERLRTQKKFVEADKLRLILQNKELI